MKKNVLMTVFFRIFVMFLSLFLGAEIALYIWETRQYRATVDVIEVLKRPRDHSKKTFILALGDSITQLGYAKILENTKGGEYSLHNGATAGSGIQIVNDVLQNNISLLKEKQHKIIVMTGHNDCLPLTQIAKEQIQKSVFVDHQTQEMIGEIRTIRFLHLLYSNIFDDKRASPSNNSFVLENWLHCSQELDLGFQDLIQTVIENKLSIHLMTYPYPKNTLPKEKWNHFMWMSMLINNYIRDIAATYKIPLIDAEACMEDMKPTHWQNDLFHLQQSGSTKHIECIFTHLGIEP